jgi:DNA repair protein RecO (recombination protein O)
VSSEKSLALVLKVVDFSETSRIVTLFTREHGKLSGLAKGARRLRSPFEAALDLLTLCRIVFIRKSSADLDLLTEASVVKRFRPKNNQLCRYYAGFYVAELLAALTEPYAPLAQLFDEANVALRRVATADGVPVSVARFELAALRELGFLPRFDACVACDERLRPAGRSFFSAKLGGVLCGRCRQTQSGVTTVTAGTIQALRWIAEPNAPVERLHIHRSALREMRELLTKYLTNLAGRPFRLHPYLKEF